MHSDFESPAGRTPVRRPSEKLAGEMQASSEALARRLREQPNRLKSLEAFEAYFTSARRQQALQASPALVAGTYCYFVPEELLHALGVIPVRLCSGFSETISPAEEVLPRDICPLVKSSFGSAVLGGGYLDECDFIILPASCDPKTKLGEYLAEYKPVWMLNLPAVKEYGAVKDFWLQEIKRLKEKLEKASGRKLEAKKLRQAIELFRKRSLLYRDMVELRKKNPGLVSHQDWLMMIQAGFYADAAEWIEQAQKVLAEMQSVAQAPPKPGARLLITGGPILWPNYKILNIIEDLGASVVADEMCSGHQRLWDYVQPDEWTLEGMLEALAARYLFPTTCPCFSNSRDRLDKLITLMEDFKVDGVIYHDLRLCQVFDMERERVHRALKEKKVPMLTLHTDYGQEDVEQLRTRVEAFLEMIA